MNIKDINKLIFQFKNARIIYNIKTINNQMNLSKAKNNLIRIIVILLMLHKIINKIIDLNQIITNKI